MLKTGDLGKQLDKKKIELAPLKKIAAGGPYYGEMHSAMLKDSNSFHIPKLRTEVGTPTMHHNGGIDFFS